ncbi:DUF5615 family PIN-like protein [Protofrankia symbiont of Coriaria ruscifolia]|uniref:DUF5615 domain-containing protein n=1 Tax=Candidatus Protofrankia californiensis TaxID=1839754 RepID=A0A1C3PGY3_9ACTN|nr:DUF5615 family PIN-like protein [Protofrankia symbiont of Coriaria ruscifolia]SBW29087.1 hypothetical protein FDG2_6419 [Candidatus Protofrankia californiensis]
MRFLLDNNLSQRLAEGPRGVGHDVVHVRDLAMGSADDETVLAFARDDDRVAHLGRYGFRRDSRSIRYGPAFGDSLPS